MNQQDTARVWRLQGREAGIHLYLSGVEGEAGALLGTRVNGLPLTLSIVPVTEWIDASDMASAGAAVIQVDADTPASIKRFERLVANAGDIPVIAAAYEPPLALVRALLKMGAHDVLPLPLTLDDLETSIAPLAQQIVEKDQQALARSSRLVSAVRARGGCGATSMLTQLACRFARNEADFGREACLIDLDVQFGDVAFQLGLQPKLTLTDLLEAGTRLDGEMIRSVAIPHASGLAVIASPAEVLPLEAITSDQLLAVVEQAQRTYGTVFVDLPANWTHWSLSLVARSDIVLLVTELSVSGLHQARRQLDLLRDQDLGEVRVEVVLNRLEKSLFKPVRLSDAETALGRPASYTVVSEPAVMAAAVERGVLIDEIKRKSAVARDLDLLENGLVAALGLER
ncbi:pilus assembly protein CpaE [Sphingomonas swuensis]